MSRRSRRHQRAPKRDQKMEDIPMTPMIDVVFQLLIYFVFTFEIPDRMAQIPVFRPAAPPPREDEPPPPPPNNLRVGVYENFYTINDTRVTTQTMLRSFNQLANLDPTQNVIVLATGNSKHGSLVYVLDLLHKSGLEKVTLMSAE